VNYKGHPGERRFHAKQQSGRKISSPSRQNETNLSNAGNVASQKALPLVWEGTSWFLYFLPSSGRKKEACGLD